MKTCLILSGGMDSTTALYQYKERIKLAICFDYKSKHNDQEYLRARNSCDKLGIELIRVDLSNVSKYLKSDLLKSGGEIPEGHYAESNMKKTVVPFRNGIMLSIAAGIAESYSLDTLMIGNHAGDHAVYPDCRSEFIDYMEAAIMSGTYGNVEIFSPYGQMDKAHIARIGNQNKVNWLDTYSCYKGGDIHCGKCSTCYERREAFVKAGVNDPTEYLDKTNFEDLKSEYERRLTNDSI